MGAVMNGREPVFLQMAANLRKMLAKTKQRSDNALWVSEIGVASTNEPGAERKQAEAIVKAYVLCLAQDIDRVFWFEGRGPAYGPSGDFGIIRHGWTKRPSFAALRTLSSQLGVRPKRLGWLNLTGQSYGFVFQGSAGPVLVTWAASDKGDKPLPWLKDYGAAEVVSCQIGAADVENGLPRLREGGDSKTVLGQVDGIHVRRTDCYESARGYRLTDQWWTIPADPGWHRYIFHVKDANFANNWGWNFRIDTVSSPDDIWVKEVIVGRVRPSKP